MPVFKRLSCLFKLKIAQPLRVDGMGVWLTVLWLVLGHPPLIHAADDPNSNASTTAQSATLIPTEIIEARTAQPWFNVSAGNGYETQFQIIGGSNATDLAPLQALLEQHLNLHEAMQHPKMNTDEWRRLTQQTPKEIADLLSTEGFFYARTSIAHIPSKQGLPSKQVMFTVTLPQAMQVKTHTLHFTGEMVDNAQRPTTHGLQRNDCQQRWRLTAGQRFTQIAWADAKRQLLSCFLQAEFPNAKITHSSANIDPLTAQADLAITIDSGHAIQFGQMHISGLTRYAPHLFNSLNPIVVGSPYRQSQLLQLQNSLMASGKFSQVEVTAPTQALAPDQLADIEVQVKELDQKNIRFGVGASTNTGARTVFNYTDRHLFGRGLLWDTSLRVEQRLQSLTSNVTFLTDAKGNRDSIQNSITRTDLEGQVTSAIQNGVRRYWGNPQQIEQFIGANVLYEFLNIDGDTAEFNKAATLAYGFNLRRLDQSQAPTKGWILNAQWQGAPLDRISDGRFLQTQARVQAFYPLTDTTQSLSRLEIGMINGASSVPATYLFRAGGDQSVRGYAFQSLGVIQNDAIVGGRVLVTGSQELVQWLTDSWGVAAFVDFGNAANRWADLRPVFGYGLGARFRSPVGPVGVDIAYGEATKDVRLHFNLGVNF